VRMDGSAHRELDGVHLPPGRYRLCEPRTGQTSSQIFEIGIGQTVGIDQISGLLLLKGAKNGQHIYSIEGHRLTQSCFIDQMRLPPGAIALRTRSSSLRWSFRSKSRSARRPLLIWRLIHAAIRLIAGNSPSLSPAQSSRTSAGVATGEIDVPFTLSVGSEARAAVSPPAVLVSFSLPGLNVAG
jgi:hypothetical protein